MQLNGNYNGRLICKALNGVHNNVLLGQIMINNIRSKRLTKILKHLHIPIIKSLYVQIFMFASVSVSIIMYCWS